MNQKQKDETIKVFAEAFHEVVVPVLEDLSAKIEGAEKRLGERIDKLDDKVEMMNRSLITVTDHQADRIDDHEKRIGKIETRVNN